jgi:hypothetical protein
MTYTTSVNLTKEIKKMHISFDGLITFKQQQKQVAEITLTPVQHKYYCSQIKEKDYKGNPFYKGVEVKRMAVK